MSEEEQWELRLYVAGESPASIAAYGNLKRICDANIAGRYAIEIIDILENPQLARSDEILAIPTLIRRRPRPTKKVIGDLSDTARVMSGLQMQAVPA